MNNMDIIRTSSKVFGLYFIIQTIGNLRDLFFNLYTTLSGSYSDNRMVDFFVGLSYNAIFNLVFGTILIFKADWVADKINSKTSEKLNINLGKTDWIELTILVISGLTILYSIPEILHKLVSYIYFNDNDKNEKQFYWTNTNKAAIFYSIFKLAIGLLLISNARNIAKRLKRVGDKEDKIEE
jgi:hypothetical protein